MDLNLYLGLPPLPRPPGRLGASMDCPAPAAATPEPEAPRTDDALAAGTGSPAPEETPPPSPPVVHWPSNALSMPVMSPIDPMLVDWLDGVSTDSEETLDAGELAAASDAASDDVDVSPPPLPAAAAASWVIPVPEAPGMDEPAELPAPEDLLPLPLVDSPPERWEMDFSWFDGPGTDSEEALDAGDQALVFDALSDDSNLSPPPMSPLPLAELEGVHLEWVERLSHPDRAAPAAGAEMVSTRQSIGGAIEDTTPELRLQRLIQVSEQHRIVRPGPVSRNQRATSPEAERLAQAIQRSHSSLDASRRPNLDSDGKMGGTVAVKKDGDCGCNSSFECNICLDAAKEPVVTPCGHLFCWPCLYQWLHGHSVHSECPVCKGEVLEVNVTPIYGRGGGERDASSNDVPPRPSANRSESMRQQQLQMPNPRGIASMVRQLIANQDHLRGPTAPPVGGVEVTVLPEGGTRIRRIVDRRQQRPVLASPSLASPSPILRRVRRAALEGGTRVRLPSSNADNALPAVPQQSSSVEQASTSSTVAVIVGQAAQSRRYRPPSEPTTARRTRRRQQH